MNFVRRFCCYSTATIPGWKDTVPFVPPISNGIVIKVYDGDTITIASKLPYKKSPLYRFSVRLNRIDAPEIKGVSKKETQMAIISRDKLAEKCLNKQVTLTEIKREKYGRVLADIHCGGICLNDWMITEKLAVEYDGGTKAKINWEEYMKKHVKK